MAKATKKEMYMREMEIHEMLAEGKTRDQIFEDCSVHWKVSPRTVETQYYKIVNAIEAIVLEGREQLRAELMIKNDYLYAKAMKNGKLKTALDINMAQAKIGGLFDDKKVEKSKSKEIKIGERQPLEVVPDKVENE